MGCPRNRTLKHSSNRREGVLAACEPWGRDGERARSRRRWRTRESGSALALLHVALGVLAASCGQGSGLGEPASTEVLGQRIVSGRTPEAGHPALSSTVALVEASEPGRAFCSGALVAPRLVMTAAHCVAQRRSAPADFLVVFGPTVLDGDAARVPVARFETTVPGSLKHFPNFDVAWVELAEDAPTGAEPVEILNDSDALRRLAADPGFRVSLAGFGRTSSDCASGDVACIGRKLVVDVRFKEYLHTPRFRDLFVVSEPGVGACNGDSGGPAYVERGGKWYLVGATNGVTRVLTPEAMVLGMARCENGGSVHTFAGAYVRWLEASAGVALTYDARDNARAPDAPPAVDAGVPTDFQGWWRFDDAPSGAWLTVNAILAELTARSSPARGDDLRRLYFDPAYAQAQAERLASFEHHGSRWAPGGDLDESIQDLRPLATLSGLEQLGLGSDRASDLRPLAALSRLQSFTLSYPKLPPEARISLAPLAALPRLTKLGFLAPEAHLDLGPLRDASGARLTFPALESFWVSFGVTDSIGILESCARAEYVSLDRMKAVDPTRPVSLAPLASLSSARGIALTANRGAFDWAGAAAALPAGALPSVKSLTLDANGIDDLSFLAAFPNLEQLNLDGNPIDEGDLVHVTALQGLTRLRINNTDVRSLSALEALPRLVELEAVVSPSRALQCPRNVVGPGRRCQIARP